MEIFCGRYANVLRPYIIDLENAAITDTPHSVSQQIYAMPQGGGTHRVPPIERVNWREFWPDIRATLHLHLCLEDGSTASPRDDLSFALRGYVTCKSVGCVNWHPTRLYHIGAVIYTPTAATINAVIIVDQNAYLFINLSEDDTGVDILQVQKIIYPLEHYVGILISGHLMKIEAWTCLHGAIVNTGLEADCRLLIN